MIIPKNYILCLTDLADIFIVKTTTVLLTRHVKYCQLYDTRRELTFSYLSIVNKMFVDPDGRYMSLVIMMQMFNWLNLVKIVSGKYRISKTKASGTPNGPIFSQFHAIFLENLANSYVGAAPQTPRGLASLLRGILDPALEAKHIIRPNYF